MSAERVAHVAWAWDATSPWHGRSPLSLAGESERLSKALERALADEAGGSVRSLIPMPADAGGESDDPDDAADPLAGLKAQIAVLRGRVGLVETTSAGWGRRSRERARSGLGGPAQRGESARHAAGATGDGRGEHHGLLRRPADWPGGAVGRESYRQWVHASVEPLARMVADELARALDAPGLRLRFDRLKATDVGGRARAWRSLVGNETGTADADARRIAGMD